MLIFIFVLVQRLLEEHSRWLLSRNAHEGKVFMECFDKQWQALVREEAKVQSESNGLLGEGEELNINLMGNYGILDEEEELSIRVIENFSSITASRLVEQEIREVVSSTCLP